MIHYKIIILLLLAWSPWDLVLPCPSICTSALQNDDFDILMKKIGMGLQKIRILIKLWNCMMTSKDVL